MPDEVEVEKRGPGRPRKPVSLGEAVTDEIEQAAGAVEQEALAALEGKETVADAVENSAADVAAAVAGETVEQKVDTAVETVEHVGLKAAEEFAAEHLPPAFHPYLDEIEEAVETRIFVVTNVITHEFAHTGMTYIVELEKKLVDGLHDTGVKALLEAKILEREGLRLVNNALSYLEVTAAKVLYHE